VSKSISPGPIILDLDGLELNGEEREILLHPHVGGVIFFSRHYESPQQMSALTQSIKKLRPELLLCVDQEGGRVQRFKEGFTRLPPLHTVGAGWDDANIHERDINPVENAAISVVERCAFSEKLGQTHGVGSTFSGGGFKFCTGG